jgi:hypothetical protein
VLFLFAISINIPSNYESILRKIRQICTYACGSLLDALIIVISFTIGFALGIIPFAMTIVRALNDPRVVSEMVGPGISIE